MTDEMNENSEMPEPESKIESSGLPSIDPRDPLASIAARAVGGKVAVIERGGKAKIVGAEDSTEDKGGNGAETAPPRRAEPEPIKIEEGDAETIRESLTQLRNTETQIAQMRVQYLEREGQLLEQRRNAQADLNSTLKTIGKRQKVPQEWVLNIETMCFEPPKRPSFPFQRR
jgi:hypothetical protein